MESRSVFADPSGRRHQVLRFAGFGTMAVIAVCLAALAVAMSGGPQAPFTQWAAPQPPSSAPGHGSHPLGGGKSSPGDTAPGPQPGSSASGGPGPGQPPASSRAGATPTASSGKTSPAATSSPTASATHGKSDGHSHRPSPSPTPKA